jgi:hypothetical protein
LKRWWTGPAPDGEVPWRLVPHGPELLALLPGEPLAFLAVFPAGGPGRGWHCWMVGFEPDGVLAVSVLRRRGRKKPRVFDDRFQVSGAVAGMLEPDRVAAGHEWMPVARFVPPEPEPEPDPAEDEARWRARLLEYKRETLRAMERVGDARMIEKARWEVVCEAERQEVPI